MKADDDRFNSRFVGDPGVRRALKHAVAALRLSVNHRRPISLPNLLRLYRRHLPVASAPAAAKGAAWLDRRYRREQPFRGTDWREWRVE